MQQPNVVFVFGDQWRAQATGYAGNACVRTPHLDRLADESLNLSHAVSGCPVCSPYRASLLSGQLPLTHGVFVNDVNLGAKGVSVAEAYNGAGYDTAYIGKWHVDGHGRSNYIPPERRKGFQYWDVLECTHNYPQSHYYAGNSPEKRVWDGYDAIAQTRDAQQYIREHDRSRPFMLMLSWGPPHNPYQTAPAEFRALYEKDALTLRPNVPEDCHERARLDLAGYYAHCSALDACIGDLLDTLRDSGLEENTLFVFTSDHGDMHGSQGMFRKQKPWDEAIRVPFLLHWPARFGREARTSDALIDAQDIMPTLLGLCDVDVPATVDGLDFSRCLDGGPDPAEGAAVIACYHPFGEWYRENGGREFRGLRTRRYTYVRTLDGPWLLYDNDADPYQMRNLVAEPEAGDLRKRLDQRLDWMLAARGDEFLPGDEYTRKWNYRTDRNGTVPYTN